MLQPVVCSRDLCVFAFQTLGVMADAADEVATGAEVCIVFLRMQLPALPSPAEDSYLPYLVEQGAVTCLT